MRDRARGGAALEFAMVLPVLLLMLFGAIEYGYYFHSTQVATAAANTGARTGVLTVDQGMGGLAAAVPAAKTAAETYLTNRKMPSTGVTASIVTVSGLNAIQVEVSYPFHGLTGFAGLALPSTVHAVGLSAW